MTAVYVLNRTPTKSVDGVTPFEVWYGKKPSVQHLQTFGCIVYVKNTRPHLSKLEDRGRRMVFIGYEKGTKGYRVYDLVAKRVHITRDVVFDEGAQWDWSQETDAETVGDGDFSVEYMVLSTIITPEEPTAREVSDQLIPSPARVLGSPPHSPEEVEEEPGLGDRLDADHDDAPLRLRSMQNLVGEADVPGQAVRNVEQGELFAVSADEPTSLEEAQQDPSWLAAMKEEIRSIEENNT
jgi:hypothetical protein